MALSRSLHKAGEREHDLAVEQSSCLCVILRRVNHCHRLICHDSDSQAQTVTTIIHAGPADFPGLRPRKKYALNRSACYAVDSFHEIQVTSLGLKPRGRESFAHGKRVVTPKKGIGIQCDVRE